jgi:hypothetical protein
VNSKQTKPNIVFAHGLWADGSCFSKLIPKLQAEGHEVVAAQTSPESSVRFEPIEILTGHGERVQTSGRDDGKSPLSQLAQQGRIK